MTISALRRGTMAGRGASGPVLGTVAYRTSTSAAGQPGSNPQTINLTIPAAVAATDLMLLFVSTLGDAAVTTPSGWTLERTDTGIGTNGHTVKTYRRIATAGDTGGAVLVPVVIGGFARYAISLVAYSGVDVANPIRHQAVTVSAVNGGTATSPSVTTTVDGSYIIECFGFTTASSGTETVTGPATQRTSPAASNNYIGQGVSDQAQATQGATGTKTATSGSGAWVAITLAIR